MKIGLFVHKIYQFEPNTGKNTQDRCDGFISVLDYAKQSFLEWVSMINDLLRKVQLGWVI